MIMTVILRWIEAMLVILPFPLFLLLMGFRLAEYGSIARLSWTWVTCPLWATPLAFLLLVLPLRRLEQRRESVRAFRRAADQVGRSMRFFRPGVGR